MIPEEEERGWGRAQEREEKIRRDGEPDIQALAAALTPITSPAEFEALTEREPALFGDAMLDHVQRLATDPNIEPFVVQLKQLIEGAHSQPADAWRAFQRAMEGAERRAREFEPVLEQLEDLISQRAYDEVIRLGDESLSRALQLGLGVVVGRIHAFLAEALRLKTTGDPGENIDAAIDHTQGALAAALDPAQRVPLQLNLAVLVASRKYGDPAQNFEHGIQVIRDALEQLDDGAPDDLRAILQMNLANMVRQREREDHLENLREARDLCQNALELRPLDRSGENWAYTKINLAAITADLAVAQGAEPDEAERHLLDVIDAANRVGVPRLIGVAHGSLGGINRRAAERIASEQNRADKGSAKAPPPGEAEASRLAAAREHLGVALDLFGPEANRDEIGRVLDDLGAVEEALGHDEDAIEVYGRALGVLRPKSMPVQCQHSGGRLGELLAHRGDWDGSASAYKMAIDAGEFGFHARLESADRAAEVERAGNLGRWAAFALAKAGDTDAAVLVLENGRTRELRRRLGLGADETLLEQIPSEARVAYQQALEDLSVASLGSDSDPAGRRLQEVLTAIRYLPGLADFAKGVAWSDVASAVEPDVPVIYVNPTPFGTVILSVASTDQGITSAAEFFDAPTALDVYMALLLGDVTNRSEPSLYLLGAAGTSKDPRPFRRGLDYVIKTLGAWVARPVADCLRTLGATGATIIACGPISQAPLHAATWSTGEGAVCLLDLFDVRFTPSATLHAACLRRARERTDAVRALTALGNPDLGDPKDDLPAAEAEVTEVALHFGSGKVAIATRGDATRAFLAGNAPTATHVHLACHARGGLLDPAESGVHLADGWVPATQLAARNLKARLTVVSACETAVAEIARLPDEAFSLSTAFLAAGSASAVATLWSIDDAATALLMTRFYEELFDGHLPTRALRRAQLWLRDLNESDEVAFLAAHPVLEDEFQRRAEQGRRPGQRSASNSADGVTPGRQPYSAPEFWAAFVVVGA